MKHVASARLEAQLFGLSTLGQPIKRARPAATAAEHAFIMVKETNSLLPYRQAVLWLRHSRGRGRILAISGTSTVERNAPQTLWLKRALAAIDKAGGEARPVSAADLKPKLG